MKKLICLFFLISMMSNAKAQQASPDSLPACIQGFITYFEEIKPESINDLNDIYAESIIFKDPIHEISGLDSLKSYFERLNSNLQSGKFEFSSVDMTEKKCHLQWRMVLQLKKPRKKIQVRGISVLTYDEKVILQEDYFDMGELAYEHIPLMGGIIRSIKKKMSEI